MALFLPTTDSGLSCTGSEKIYSYSFLLLLDFYTHWWIFYKYLLVPSKGSLSLLIKLSIGLIFVKIQRAKSLENKKIFYPWRWIWIAQYIQIKDEKISKQNYQQDNEDLFLLHRNIFQSKYFYQFWCETFHILISNNVISRWQRYNDTILIVD